jgi:hypothetical protein
MTLPPAVIVHGLADARAALAAGAPVTLLSAPGAALFAGCLWWRHLLAAAGPEAESAGLLDCADASGAALGALRCGVTRLVLWPDAPARDAVAGIALRQGGFVLDRPPAALDLGERNAIRRLHAWLRVPGHDGG